MVVDINPKTTEKILSYNPNPLNIIYLDRDQCDDFNVNYFGGSVIRIPADALLRSKRNGYDRKHVDLLSPLGSEIIHLIRDEGDAPGWYRFDDAENSGASHRPAAG